MYNAFHLWATPPNINSNREVYRILEGEDESEK
jgi:hypothetical protein